MIHMPLNRKSTITDDTKKRVRLQFYRSSEIQKVNKEGLSGNLLNKIVNMIIYLKRASDIWALIWWNMGFLYY